MCRYFRIGFIDFMLKGRSFLDYTNLFSPNEYENNNKIPKLFSITKKFKMKKIYCLICGKNKKFKNPIMLYIFEKNISSFFYLH